MSSDERWVQLRKEVRRMHPDYGLALEKLEKIPVGTDFTVLDLGGWPGRGGQGVIPVVRAAIALKIVARPEPPLPKARGRFVVYRRLR